VAKPIRRTAAKQSNFEPDPALTIEHGAHLRIEGTKLFAPKFHDETGDLWGATVSLRLYVVDDRTADGDDDDKEFFDRFDLKFDEAVAQKFGIGPAEDAKDDKGNKLTLDKFLKNANKRDFTPEQQKALLDEDNWTVREGTKLAKLLACLYGPEWSLDLDDLEGKEFLASVHPRTGKKSGSYCGWESFMALYPPKKKGKKAEKPLTPEEEAQMNEALPPDEDAA
jgi:hypothetical protein